MFFCQQKWAYEMRISYWRSDVCSSDLNDVVCLIDGRPSCEMAIGDALMLIAFDDDDENGDDIVRIEWVAAAHATLAFRAMQNVRSGGAVSSSSSSAPTTPPRSKSSQQEPNSAATSSDREAWRERQRERNRHHNISPQKDAQPRKPKQKREE